MQDGSRYQNEPQVEAAACARLEPGRYHTRFRAETSSEWLAGSLRLREKVGQGETGEVGRNHVMEGCVTRLRTLLSPLRTTTALTVTEQQGHDGAEGGKHRWGVGLGRSAMSFHLSGERCWWPDLGRWDCR